MSPVAPAALLFDVFGTLVDWRAGVIAELRALESRTGARADWEAFADAWRGAYAPSMDRVRSGAVAWRNLDVLHRESLDALIERFALDAVTAAERERVTHAWHRLPPWPDTVAGLTQLRGRFILASLSNGNVALQVDLRRYAELPLDMLFSAELFRHYKPDPQAYVAACELLALEPARVMLVAAHPSDLHAAAGCGLRTAYIARPLEWGPRATPPSVARGTFDFQVESVPALAAALGG